MLTTKRKPASVGEILIEEFMEPMGLTQGALAEAMGVQRKHVNELCNDRRNVTAPTALILARAFGNSPDFWLNVQRRSDLWEAMHSPKERERIERARPIGAAARHMPPPSYRRQPELDSEIHRPPVPPRQPIAAESALAICTYSAPSEISLRRETLRPTHPTPENQTPFQFTVIYCRITHKLVF